MMARDLPGTGLRHPVLRGIKIMGILDFAEKAFGAVAADKALEAVDPNANFIEKAAAAVAGFEGVAAVQDHFNSPKTPDTEADAAPADQSSEDPGQ
jgi:hypothetical protein